MNWKVETASTPEQGFEENSHEQDNVVFKEIFNFLKTNNFYHIQGIILNIKPQKRATATLQRQANLITQFGDQEGYIWDNVLIDTLVWTYRKQLKQQDVHKGKTQNQCQLASQSGMTLR